MVTVAEDWRQSGAAFRLEGPGRAEGFSSSDVAAVDAAAGWTWLVTPSLRRGVGTRTGGGFCWWRGGLAVSGLGRASLGGGGDLAFTRVRPMRSGAGGGASAGAARSMRPWRAR